MTPPFSIDYDTGFGSLARLGLVVLSTDETIENEARVILGDRPVGLLCSRVQAHADVTPQTLKLMEADMPRAAGMLPQYQDVIGYACTSGATIIGPDEVARLVNSTQPDTPVTNPISSVVAACRALDVTRIAYISPYVETVTAPMRSFLETQGIHTVYEDSFRVKEDWSVARIPENITKNMVLQVIANSDAQAVFASCTNLRTLNILDQLEQETGLPMISSNQALIWNMLKIAGVSPTGWGPGRLFRL